jgi:hypothetical protein
MGKDGQIVRRKAGLTCFISHVVGSSSRPKLKLNQPTPRPRSISVTSAAVAWIGIFLETPARRH